MDGWYSFSLSKRDLLQNGSHLKKTFDTTILRGLLQFKGRSWQLTLLADLEKTQRAEVYTRSHSKARMRQMIHRIYCILDISHSLTLHTTLTEAMCTVFFIEGRFEGWFGDSQFFWNCAHSTCQASDEPFENGDVEYKSDLELKWGSSFKWHLSPSSNETVRKSSFEVDIDGMKSIIMWLWNGQY